MKLALRITAVLMHLQYFTQFGHMAELSECEFFKEKHANSQAK
jgi:hypothetical protein